MKLTFSWEDKIGWGVEPYCSADVVNKDGMSLLACLLVDDGGTGYLSSVPWIDDGIAMIDAVMKGEVADGDWARETWGAKLKPDEVEIYSLYQEDYSEVVPSPAFRHALLAWREFIQSTPDVNTVLEVDV
jgi:hypothetical protein